MVRIFKVKELEEKRRFYVARSEMYRQTLTLEVANVKFALALLKRKFDSLRGSYRMLGILAPLAALLLGRKQVKKRRGGGFLTNLLAGFKFFGQLKPFLQKFRATPDSSPERKDITEFP